MATQWQRIITLLLIFLLGVVAGSGLGYLYGKDTTNTELQQELTEIQSRFETVNQNYLVLVREYNKLFKLGGPAVQPVAAVQAVESETYQVPASDDGAAEAEAELSQPPPEPEPQATAAEGTTEPVETEESVEATETQEPAETTEAEESPEATTEPTEEPAAAEETEEAGEASDVAPPEADFEAESVGGTGPLEGPPPQPFRFTDLSTGEIDSWEWEFGDEQTSTKQNPEHTYYKCPNDLCTVKLTVCGPGGCDTEVKEDYLWVSEGCSGC